MYYIGIDIGGMSIKGGLVTQDGSILLKKTIVTGVDKKDRDIVLDIAALINDIISEYKIKKEDIKGIGIGSPGSVYDEKGIIRYCCNIPFRNTEIVKILKNELGINNIFVSNDANCACLGETMFGAAKGHKNTILMTLGTGVGTGFIVDGKLLTGFKSAGAEGGHIQINIGGKECGCGKKGHLEAYASAKALMQQIDEACIKNPDSLLNKLKEKEGLDGKIVFEAAKEGCKTAKSVLKKYIKYLGMGLVTLANVFFPEVIIIGGGVSNAGDDLIKPLQRYVSRNIYGSEFNPKIKVMAAELKNDAGIIGAACLAM
ncbi:MAG: ROK family protein [Clostridia bacterium]|nr:ROK family protein [Clostridia bacterium]